MRSIGSALSVILCGLCVACGEKGEETDGTASGATTGASDSSTTNEPTDGGSATDIDPTGNASGEYAAFFRYKVSSEYIRMSVRRYHAAEDLCVDITFISVQIDEVPEYVVTAPPMFDVEWSLLLLGASDCLATYQALPTAEPVSGLSATGSVSWPLTSTCPDTVDIDVVLEFPPDFAWVPAQETLKANGIPVQQDGC